MIGIIGILAAVLWPAFDKALAGSRNARCLGNMRQIGPAMLSFAAENNGHYPPRAVDTNQFPGFGQFPKWYNLLQQYVQNQSRTGKSVWECPADSRTNISCSYGMNVNPSPYPDNDRRLIPLAALKGPPSKVIYAADTGGVSYDQDIIFWGTSPKGKNVEYRHLGSRRDQSKPYGSAQEVTDQRGQATFLFFDGHVESLRDDQLTREMFFGR